METVSPKGLQGLLAFTALRLEYGWVTTPLTSGKLKNLPRRGARLRANQLEAVESQLLN